LASSLKSGQGWAGGAEGGRDRRLLWGNGLKLLRVAQAIYPDKAEAECNRLGPHDVCGQSERRNGIEADALCCCCCCFVVAEALPSIESQGRSPAYLRQGYGNWAPGSMGSPKTDRRPHSPPALGLVVEQTRDGPSLSAYLAFRTPLARSSSYVHIPMACMGAGQLAGVCGAAPRGRCNQ